MTTSVGRSNATQGKGNMCSTKSSYVLPKNHESQYWHMQLSKNSLFLNTSEDNQGKTMAFCTGIITQNMSDKHNHFSGKPFLAYFQRLHGKKAEKLFNRVRLEPMDATTDKIGRTKLSKFRTSSKTTRAWDLSS